MTVELTTREAAVTKYNGRLQTKAQAARWLARLEAIGTIEAKAAASLLSRSWEYVAARPALAERMVKIIYACPHIEACGGECWEKPLDRPACRREYEAASKE